MQGNFLVFAHASPRACPRRASLVVRVQFKIHSNFVQYTPRKKRRPSGAFLFFCGGGRIRTVGAHFSQAQRLAEKWSISSFFLKARGESFRQEPRGSITGYLTNCPTGNCATSTIPELTIRNPQWTLANNWQGIPIIIFTPDQWSAVLAANLSVSAAPIPPSELGSNTQYVFALPARYNYAYPEGWQEVQTILQGNPLQGF